MFVCLVIVLVYTSVTLWQWFGEDISRLNCIENAVEFATSLLSAVILSLTVSSRLYLLLVIVFCLRCTAFLLSRKRLLRDFNNVEYCKVATTVLETATIGIIQTTNTNLIAFFACLTVTLQVVH